MKGSLGQSPPALSSVASCLKREATQASGLQFGGLPPVGPEASWLRARSLPGSHLKVGGLQP